MVSILIALLAGCGDEPVTPVAGWAPELACPAAGGDCAPTDDLTLRAAAAVRSIVPDCYESWEDVDGTNFYGRNDHFFDCGCDQLCPEDDGWVAADEGEGDGLFQAAWLAGFGPARPATGVRGAGVGMIGEGDGLDARVLVLDQGNTRLAIVALDSIGTMYDQVLEIRAAVEAADLGIDHVVVHSTHSHSAIDMMGIYGPNVTTTGFSRRYADQIAAAVVDAAREAVPALRQVTMKLGEVDTSTYSEKGVGNLIRDTRDPVVIDPRLGVLQLVDGTETVATVVHWANHPETIADRNNLMTSDFVHGVRRTVTTGSNWPGGGGREGVGGVTLYINGAVGGMMTSLGAQVTDPDGNTWQSASWEKTDAVGQLVGEAALDAVEGAVDVPTPRLRFGASPIRLPVDNFAFQAMFLVGVLAHRTAEYDESQPLSETNVPEAPTEVDIVELGPLRMLTIPGELLPELAVGGYDGSFTPPTQPLIDPENEAPPDLTQAPAGPYLLERLGGGQGWVIGLGNDEVGYIIPPYNFVVADAGAFVFEAPGDHYEETNSLGPRTAPLIEEAADALIDWLNGNP